MKTKLTPRKLKAGTFRTGHSLQMMMMMMTRIKMWIMMMMIIREGGGVNHDDYDDNDDANDDDDTNSTFRRNLRRFDYDFDKLTEVGKKRLR